MNYTARRKKPYAPRNHRTEHNQTYIPVLANLGAIREKCEQVCEKSTAQVLGTFLCRRDGLAASILQPFSLAKTAFFPSWPFPSKDTNTSCCCECKTQLGVSSLLLRATTDGSRARFFLSQADLRRQDHLILTRPLQFEFLKITTVTTFDAIL